MSKKNLNCKLCDGHYEIRKGKSWFAGCSNYRQSKCKSTLQLYEYALEVIKLYGINIYKWEKECWKCKKLTPVYSYYLNYDLGEFDVFFRPVNNGDSILIGDEVGLGDLPYVDNILSQKIPSIKLKYSRTTNSNSISNTCIYCGSLQGRNYVVDDPHEITTELWYSRDMVKYHSETIFCGDIEYVQNEIKELYSSERFLNVITSADNQNRNEETLNLYKLKASLLTTPEKDFYKQVLLPITSKYELSIAKKPRMADFIDVDADMPNKDGLYSFRKISQKHVDFLLCCTETLKPIMAIELNDGSHFEDDRIERDEFVNKIYKEIGLKVAHYYNYTFGKVEKDIMDAIISQIKCKNCNGKYKMWERKNDIVGECSNAPNCKSTIRIEEAVKLLKAT